MSEHPLIGRQRTLLRDLARLGAEQARIVPVLAQDYRKETDRAEMDHEEAVEALRKRFLEENESLDQECEDAREQAESRYRSDQDACKKEHGRIHRDLTARLATETEAAEAAFEEANWTAEATLEAALSHAQTRFRDHNVQLDERMEELAGLYAQANALLVEWKHPLARSETPPDEPMGKEFQPRKLNDYFRQADVYLGGLRNLSLPRFLNSFRPHATLLLLWLALLSPLGWLLAPRFVDEPTVVPLLGIGAGAAAILCLALGVPVLLLFGSVARKQVAGSYLPLRQVMREARAAKEYFAAHYLAERDRALLEANQRHERPMNKTRTRREQKRADIDQRRTLGLTPLESNYKAQRRANENRRAKSLRDAEDRHATGHAHLDAGFASSTQEEEARYQATLDEIRERYGRLWQRHLDRWRPLLADALTSETEIIATVDALFPAWDDPAWIDWRPTGEVPPVVRFGSSEVSTHSIVEVHPWKEPRPAPVPITLTLPALFAFPEPASLLLRAEDEGRDRAVEALRAVMFRLMTSLPPGRVRFIIVDPVGLGQNFAAFMNLADHDEALAGSRIWTEAGHIEQRLADLTGHMENVIQKYLRNRYATISEYNAQAGEVAEPFRVLVVANFPANFSTEAARRLVSITRSGPRCGVSTLISVDTRQPLPKGFDLADLEGGVRLDWDRGHFRWVDEDFSRVPLALDAPPADDDFCNRILQRVGEAARGAQRVEVPFEFIAPPPDRWWAGSTRQEISVAIGRAGATRRQHLELGKGTSQHVVIAGKTGSGKSTLLHALITNLALQYSPDEVELYLIDFKKGVEFKTYAVHELPHARVIAIESEREFGLSVLKRLDVELKGRGERFRAVGAQDLNAYRQAAPGERSPRLLLIVDEFQEFFVEDDKIAQETAQLLDRLVRQGRAFGMHVLLGSQTLGGAYSLARSTIDQMAVRIALQCSEADAHLILSDDNSAARLLSRPGEAIYNDANGLVEGNDPFQVVWLGDDVREQYLTRIRGLAQERRITRPPAVVFEGNAAADIGKNHPLNALLAAPPNGDAPDVEYAWLGEAMAIDELTAAGFRRQNGSNLVMVGQQPESALAMLATAVISLAAHAPAVGCAVARFTVVDGRQPDPPSKGTFARLPDLLPEPVRVIGTLDLASVLADLTSELGRRQKSPAERAPSTYLVLYGLHRLRDLRRQEDDFGYSARGEEKPITPDKQLATLLREGPPLGMHTLIWCDTLTNLQRAFDRQAMRELALRVAFQMNVADSSNLIDSPAASKLGLHRALLSSEEEGKVEKFRPYEVPREAWLGRVRELLGQRGPARSATPANS
jgi:DNA segregation ATPase FtsK/SpoIIIE, S-DNA-T family